MKQIDLKSPYAAMWITADEPPNPSDAISDEALVRQIAATPEAFSTLYQRYFSRIYAYVAYRVGNAHDTEDLTAEIFTRLIETLPQFSARGDGSFAAWLFTLARHRIADFYRRQSPVQTLSLDDLPEMQNSDFVPPDIAIQEKERFARLRRAIQQLSPRRQEIVTMRFFGELRNNEIADVLGLDERTVAAHLSRALADLAERYRPE